MKPMNCKTCGLAPSPDLAMYGEGALANWIWLHVGTAHPGQYRTAMRAIKKAMDE